MPCLDLAAHNRRDQQRQALISRKHQIHNPSASSWSARTVENVSAFDTNPRPTNTDRLAAFGVTALAWAASMVVLYCAAHLVVEWFWPVMTRGSYFGEDRVPTRDPEGSDVLGMVLTWLAAFAVFGWSFSAASVLSRKAELFFARDQNTVMAKTFAGVGVVAGVIAGVALIAAVVVGALIWMLFGGLLYATAIVAGFAAVNAVVD